MIKLSTGFRRARPTAPGVSHRMQGLINDLKAAETYLASVDPADGGFRWDEAAGLESNAMMRLLDEAPANMAEFTAKFAALLPAIALDEDQVILKALLADARALAGEDRP